MKRRVRSIEKIFGVLTLMGSVSFCQPSPEVVEDIQDFFEQGNILIVLCSRSGLRGCDYMGGVNVTGAPVKWDVQHIPAEIGNDNLRSLMVVCGVPAAVLVYEHHHFTGNVDVYHCEPGAALEVHDMRYVSGVVSSIVFTGDNYAVESQGGGFDDPVLQHTGVDFALVVGPFGDEVEAGFEADDDIEEVADRWATQIDWTDLLNAFGDPEFGDPSVYETGTNQDALRSVQELHFAVGMEINPNWWPSNYDTWIAWYIRSAIVAGNDRLDFEVDGWDVWVEGGTIADDIADGIAGQMDSKGELLATRLEESIVEAGDNATGVPGFGELLIVELTSIGWTVFDPKPCNSIAFVPCEHYRAVPPTLILHKE